MCLPTSTGIALRYRTALPSYIVEKGYGYETDALFGGTVPLFQGLLVGDIDVTMEIWLP